MRFDFLVSASPTDGFFGQIAFFRSALNALGGDYADARLVAVFGDHDEEKIPDRWRLHFDAIEVEWAHRPGATNVDHRAQHDRRFQILRPDADLAFLCDADIAIMRSLDELSVQLLQKPSLAGVIAHYHFPWEGRERDPDRDWTELSHVIIGKDIERPYRYTLVPEETAQYAPFYINYGLLAGPPDLLRYFHERDIVLRDRVAAMVSHWWAPQISLTLTCADLDLPTMALPMRYNFPNDPIADSRYPDELSNVVLMHYLRTRKFDRAKIFSSAVDFQTFVESRFVGSDEVFRKAVCNITGGHFPFGSDISA